MSTFSPFNRRFYLADLVLLVVVVVRLGLLPHNRVPGSPFGFRDPLGHFKSNNDTLYRGRKVRAGKPRTHLTWQIRLRRAVLGLDLLGLLLRLQEDLSDGCVSSLLLVVHTEREAVKGWTDLH